MLKDVKVPEISENVTSGTIVEVLVKVGDTVAVDDVLVELERPLEAQERIASWSKLREQTASVMND